jgi:YVTN family beta-propeller protein
VNQKAWSSTRSPIVYAWLTLNQQVMCGWLTGRTNTLVATVPVGDSPCGIAVNLLTRRVYAANAGENKISVIDARTNKVIANVLIAGNPMHVAVDELRNRIYCCNIGKKAALVFCRS